LRKTALLQRFVAVKCDAMATIDSQKLLSPAEVAARLGVSKITVYRRIADGSIPATRLGRDGASTPLRVSEQALERWLWSDPPDEAA
jgi:excisionase family DNA binding protein